jgi:predicted kinase/tRNA A-37 threonylcarbamoyl transferase component Bud32
LKILNENRVKKLAQIIAKFHKNNIEAPLNIKVNSFKSVKQNWQENFEQTKLFINSTINQKQFDFIRKRVESFILNKEDLFQKRIANHKIREGHGDLHTGNIFFYKNNFYIFDAIEFNERFRFEDITSDLAFILMDLEFHHYENLSKIILEEYIKLTKDRELLLLVNFYKCYRAYVRGKILSFQTNNQNLTASQRKKTKTTAKKYFALAHDYAIQIFSKPIFLIMCGFTGSGKTHLSQLLNQRLGLNMIQSDVILKRSVGLKPQTRKYLKFEHGIFSQKSRDKNYLHMIKLAEKNLKQNQGVVLDASFIYRRWRNLAEMIAKNLNIPYLIIHCQVPKNIISKRLKIRAKNDFVSDGRPYIYENQKKVFENFTKKEKVLRIDTTENFNKILRKIAHKIETLI